MAVIYFLNLVFLKTGILKNFSHTISTNTVIFIMVVSPAVLAHDVSARAGNVSMGIAVFLIGSIYPGPFEKLGDG